MFDMPTDRPVRPRRGWWLAPELAALAALLVLTIPVLSTSQPKLQSDIGRRAAQAIEASTPEEHKGHGHEIEIQGADHVVCGVDVFGTEPRSVAAADEVRTVYGYYFCAVGPDGTPYMESSRMDGPVVIRFTNPPVIQIARSGQGYEDRVRAMMPDEYEPLCFGGLRNDAVAADVRRRFTDLARAG